MMHEIIARGGTRDEQVRRLLVLCDTQRVAVAFFGCLGKGQGHHLYSHATDAWELERRLRTLFGRDLDQSFAPSLAEQPEGRCLLTHVAGWTAVGFWDRTGDRRRGANSAIVACGTLSFAQMIRLFRQQWPQMAARLTFPLVQVDAGGQEMT